MLLHPLLRPLPFAFTLGLPLLGCEVEPASFGRGPGVETCTEERPECSRGYSCVLIPDVPTGTCLCTGERVENCGVTPCVCEPIGARSEGEPCSSDESCADGMTCRVRDVVGTIGCGS